ncbi:MAG: hypothetical protein M0011_00615, partial [Elusimicrobia bacterium]|nr:hypothetical protein [Elusimicrobiota bacterium]
LAAHSSGAKAAVLKGVLLLIPNFQLFNVRDLASALPAAAFAAAALWTAGACLAASWLLSGKEF